MLKATLARAKNSDLIVNMRGCLDFRGKNLEKDKGRCRQFKNSAEAEKEIQIFSPRSAKIKRAGQVVVGFALETENMEKNAISNSAGRDATG